MACGIGCAVVFLIVIAVVVFIGVKAKQAIDQVNATMERAQEVSARQSAARARIAALDEAHPPSIGEDLAQAELSEADVARYLELHAALAEPLAAHEAVQVRIREFEATMKNMENEREPSFRELMGVMSAAKDAMSTTFEAEETMAVILEEAATAMEGAGLGPSQLRRLTGIIGWQFLEREGFEELALTEEDAADLRTARAQVELWGEDEFDSEQWTREEWDGFQAKLVEHRKTIGRLEARLASGQGRLAPGTRAKLESRRGELEAISPADALAVLELTQDFVGFDDFGDREEEPGPETTGSDENAGGE
jgi:hypothetical protein